MRAVRGAFNPWWNQLNQFQGEMNRLFDRLVGNGGAFPAAVFPTVNVWEENDQVCLEAELPGVDFKGLEIYVTGGNQLTLKGERQSPVPGKGFWHRQEREYGSFVRTVQLPCPVDPDKVDARLEAGVLTVRLAKHASAQPRKIAVKAE